MFYKFYEKTTNYVFPFIQYLKAFQLLWFTAYLNFEDVVYLFY